MPLTAAEIADLPGVPESRLPAAVASQLPESTPDAPWSVKADGVIWFHKAAEGARDALPTAVRDLPALPVTLGALISYRDTPVGPYHEVLGAPLVLRNPLPHLSVPFIAVDSVPSVHGGRAHWGLPKVLAAFDWLPSGPTVAADGDGWSVRVDTRAFPVPFPYAGVLPQLQPLPGARLGRSLARLFAFARPALVTVATDGPSLPTWLVPGRHPGLVLSNARMVVGRTR
ncbi:MAG TPA: acetoacetate decarboxylase family protein [Mycobacteriales bacterium]|nr:acetoacetate decarboxylase family protein [Mycobacteriales bacterium]